MKKVALVLVPFWMASLISFAQILQPASWSFNTSRDTVRVGEEVDLLFTVNLVDTWYIYSNDFDPDLGPMLTEFEFTPNKSYELVGEVRAIRPKRKYDEIWEGEVSYFEGRAEFRQTIKVLGTDLRVNGRYIYQVCTTLDGKCIPGNGAFSFENVRVLAAAPTGQDENKKEKNKAREGGKTSLEKRLSNETEARVINNTIETVDISQYRPVQNMVPDQEVPDEEKAVVKKDLESSIPKADRWAEAGLISFSLLAFLAGLAALLTPCVFPMIPMTVTFFTNNSKDRKAAVRTAFIYGFSIIVIYVVAGTLVAWVNGPAFANWLSTHWLPNLFFFAVFVVFALSFLGLFEITLPSGLVNQVDRKADKGGLLGVFFMALTLVLVSFSCTTPIVGAILVASAGGKVIMPVLGMASFAIAFAIPFTLFAAFPQWLSNLPKSGGWLNSVKVVLGFLELALGLKFLSIADQVYHWGILDREIYLALWIVIFSMTGFYLLGKVRLPHDSPLEKVGVLRLMLAIASFAFVVYLVPGMFGAPLKALAGYLPPMSTHDYNLAGIFSDKHVNLKYASNEDGLCEDPLYAEMLSFPHGIKGYFKLEQAVACAKQQGKPIFIDFTGHGCVNCREMEARVWSDPEVLKRLMEDYVMLALYVDEKTELPKSEWYRSAFDGGIKKTLGAQNADYQIVKFNNNAQPYYVLMNPYTQAALLEPWAYDLNVSNFIDFLDKGTNEFKNATQLAMKNR